MTDAANVDTLSFEKALAELESIVAKLEGGNVPLEESISLYARGEALKARCDALLKDAEARVEKITQGSDGRAIGTVPLDGE